MKYVYVSIVCCVLADYGPTHREDAPSLLQPPQSQGSREIIAIALSAGLDSVSKQTKVGNTTPLLHDITE